MDTAGRGPGVVHGNCGFSNISLWGGGQKAFQTGYTIYPEWGLPIQHNWWVEAATTQDVRGYNLTGIPSLTSQTWSTTRNFSDMPGFANYAKVVTGTVFTAAGSVCFSGNPVATPGF